MSAVSWQPKTLHFYRYSNTAVEFVCYLSGLRNVADGHDGLGPMDLVMCLVFGLVFEFRTGGTILQWMVNKNTVTD